MNSRDTDGVHRPLRFVTAASLFDGHDAAINIMRRLIQSRGAEVIHLGHNRSAQEVVAAAIQEDVDAVAISSYQGGHMEYFRYVIDLLKENGAGHVCVFGGGGGTITLQEIEELQAYGVARIYHPRDGLEMGLDAMITDLMERTHKAGGRPLAPEPAAVEHVRQIARVISALEDGDYDEDQLPLLRAQWAECAEPAPVIGITGTGGAGKSSVTDELLNRFLSSFPKMKIAVVAVDPTRRRTGGALLGDRIRMNSLRSERLYMRSIATRRQHRATSEILFDTIAFLRSSAYDLVLVETAGIGQSDTDIVDLVDFSLYVMTSDYGAASQLEKIDMLDYADLIVLNKYDRRGAEDALREVRKQWRRNRNQHSLPDSETPVYPTIASHFNDSGLNWMFAALCRQLAEKLKLPQNQWDSGFQGQPTLPAATPLIPGERVRYLAEIAEQADQLVAKQAHQSRLADDLQHLHGSLQLLGVEGLEEQIPGKAASAASDSCGDSAIAELQNRYDQTLAAMSPDSLDLLSCWPQLTESVVSENYSYSVRGEEVTGTNYRASLSGTAIPKVAAPKLSSWGDRLRFLQEENLPGHFPFTAGVFAYRRVGEDPTRMFAGEGTPERTNTRFHYLSCGAPAKRLSTAFDSVTLYGEDPGTQPDVFGKIGNAGVSIATLDDLKKLYSGFDLCARNTSVSMTINGPAPIALAFFLNAAVDQQVERYLRNSGDWAAVERELATREERVGYEGPLPEGHDGLGLGLLGVTGDEVVEAETYARIRSDTLMQVRGTVQADILKEDQAQNTCIFSTQFGLRMMGDVQAYFIANGVRNYYSVSISGYHIAEAGANPITQLAFTLANGFTIVEYYLARGMKIDEFASNLSFFFSNGMDPEYSVIGRVARRIWARAMRYRYGAGERSQKLKYHIQTSGRSLHAQEMQFNDIRTTLQALYAIFDNCNSLHTNAFDEAVTTPTEASVRRAVAIQMIINKELGLNACENVWQGSFALDKITDLVEKAVYQEFTRISERGGVLGAMDTMYQRGKIQDESMRYEQRKHDGSLPLVGVNTFLAREAADEQPPVMELMRSSEQEKQAQLRNLAIFHRQHAATAPAALESLAATAAADENIFAELLETVKCCSIGQITHELFGVGGEYRRNM